MVTYLLMVVDFQFYKIIRVIGMNYDNGYTIL